MDQGWVMTFAAVPVLAAPQISIASEGGSGTSVPDISIEVDDFEDVLQRALAAGYPVEYGPRQEPWGVRRFYVRDPFGRLVNILTHILEDSGGTVPTESGSASEKPDSPKN